MGDLLKVISVLILIVFICLLPLFFGKWCAHNTELLANYYLEKQIDLPRWPFVVGCYLTQGGLPYGIVTEVWCQILELK